MRHKKILAACLSSMLLFGGCSSTAGDGYLNLGDGGAAITGDNGIKYTIVNKETETEERKEETTIENGEETIPESLPESQTETDGEVLPETPEETLPESQTETVTETSEESSEETSKAPSFEWPAFVLDSECGNLACIYMRDLSENFPMRVSGTDQERAAGEWVKGKLELMGYSVERQDFNSPSGTVSSNYTAKKPGNSEEVIVVCSHYDSVGSYGADDNASGVGAELEIAQKLIQAETTQTIWFCFYGSEEPGEFGSAAYVKSLSAEELSKVKAVINIDSICAGDVCFINGGRAMEDGSVTDTWFRDLAMQTAASIGFETSLHPACSRYPEGTRNDNSDQAYWVLAGKPYIYYEAGLYSTDPSASFPYTYQTADPRVPNGKIMHTELDRFDTIDQLFPGRIHRNQTKYVQLSLALLTKGV